MTPLPHFLGDEAPDLVRVHGGGEGIEEIWVVTRAEQRRVPRIRKVVQFVTDVVHLHQKRLFAPTSEGEHAVDQVAYD